jgi:hypothetical protein
MIVDTFVADQLKQSSLMQLLPTQPSHYHWRIFQQSDCSKIAGLLVLLLAMAFVGTNTAHGSCGDYLAIHGSNAAMRTTQSPPTNSRSSDERSQVPCDGPSCKRQTEFPATPVPPLVVQNGGEQFGISGNDRHPLSLSCSERLSSDVPLLQQGFRQRIERPPRVLSTVL